MSSYAALRGLAARPKRRARAETHQTAGKGLRERAETAAVSIALSLALFSGDVASVAAVPPGKKVVTPEELVEIVREDMVERKYLITALLTKEVYADDATFADSNNDFGPGLDSFVSGTQRLFVSKRCKLALTGDVVYDAEARQITVTSWRQVDVFRLPGAPHTPVFTGKTILTLAPDENIVIDHTEIWDQKPSEIVSQLKFFDPDFDPPGF
mmetsp:Transcript_10892/g.35836  ORF Transcript_10892/g.35836 Transcript_10892/m.35836 type:complete len:212 (-) Transcript_10892:85-720(-)